MCGIGVSEISTLLPIGIGHVSEEVNGKVTLHFPIFAKGPISLPCITFIDPVTDAPTYERMFSSIRKARGV